MAQLNESDTARWQVNSNLSVRLNTGNVERLIITPELNAAHLPRRKTWGFSARQRFTYGTFGAFRTENDLLSRNFLYLYPTRRIYPYLMVWLQTHALQMLDFRYQAGLGITVVPLRKNQHVIKLSATATHEQNWYRERGLQHLDNPMALHYAVFRITARVYGSHSFSQQAVSIYYECLFQQATDNENNWRVFAESGITSRITKQFSMRTYINYEYQQVHLLTRKPHDLVLNVGLNYQVRSRS